MNDGPEKEFAIIKFNLKNYCLLRDAKAIEILNKLKQIQELNKQ